LQPVRKQHHANEPVGADGEAALVEGHERHLIPLGRARHGLVGGDDPLDGVGEGRKLARLDQTEELLMGDIGACPIRHHNDEVLGELEAQAVAVLWMWKNSERQGASARGRRSRWGGKVPNQRPTRCLKGGRPDPPPSKPGPGETTAHSRDASVPAEYGFAESMRSHDGAVTSVTLADMLTPITASTSPRRP
jgi:hypothetical protein